MGVVLLLLTVAGFSATYLAIRLATARGHTALSATAVMLAVSAGVVGVWFLVNDAAWNSGAVAWGVVGGVCGALAFWAVAAALKIGHYGLTNASVPLAAFVPIAASWIVWSEPVTPLALVATAVLFAGLFLITLRGHCHAHDGGTSFGWVVLVLLALACNGSAAITQVVVSRNHSGAVEAFLLAIFVAGAVPLLAAAVARGQVRGSVLPLGVAAGLANALTNICLMAALARVEPAIAYPVFMGGPVLVAFVLSRTLFREKTHPVGYIGVALGLTGVVLLCVQQ